MQTSSRRHRRRSSASVVAAYKLRRGEGKYAEPAAPRSRRDSHTARAARRASVRRSQTDPANNSGSSKRRTMDLFAIDEADTGASSDSSFLYQTQRRRRPQRSATDPGDAIERPDQFRIQSFLHRVRSGDSRHSGGFNRNTGGGAERPSLSSTLLSGRDRGGSGGGDGGRSSFDSPSPRADSSGGRNNDNDGGSWYDSVYRQEIEHMREERQRSARKKARASICRHDGSELLTLLDDQAHLDSPRLSHLVSLLRYYRGYPVQSNYTRFEFPAGIFHSDKHSVKGAQLFSSLLRTRPSSKRLKRLEFCMCYFGAEAVDILMSGLEANASIRLTDFSLRGNAIGVRGAERIARYLRLGDDRLANLERLDLSSCELGDEGILALFEAVIETTTGLQRLTDVDVTGDQRFDVETMYDLLDDMEAAGLSHVRVHFDQGQKLKKKKKKKKKIFLPLAQYSPPHTGRRRHRTH